MRDGTSLTTACVSVVLAVLMALGVHLLALSLGIPEEAERTVVTLVWGTTLISCVALLGVCTYSRRALSRRSD
jgi:hypothetical protein